MRHDPVVYIGSTMFSHEDIRLAFTGQNHRLAMDDFQVVGVVFEAEDERSTRVQDWQFETYAESMTGPRVEGRLAMPVEYRDLQSVKIQVEFLYGKHKHTFLADLVKNENAARDSFPWKMMHKTIE